MLVFQITSQTLKDVDKKIYLTLDRFFDTFYNSISLFML